MTISRHTYSARVVGSSDSVSLKAGTVTLDESWSPYAQVKLTIPTKDAAALALVDPRAGARVLLDLRSDYGSSAPVAALSSAWAGLTLADLSTLYAGANLGAISSEYGTPYNEGPRPSTSRRLNLGVRSRSVTASSAQVVLDLASDEALLQDHGLISPVSIKPSTNTVRAAVQLALSRIGALLPVGSADAPVEATAMVWEPGVSAWDYVSPLVQAAGLRLWCDERRVWHLSAPLAPAAGALVVSDATAVEIEQHVTRDEDWWTGVVIRYRWRDSAGQEQTRYDTAGTEERVLYVEHARPWPGDGAAASMLSRTRGRGRLDQVTAVSDYGATPGQMLQITTPDSPTQTGLASSVEWDLSADRMSVRSRELIDTPATAWLLVPVGQTWLAAPAGSWTSE